jgi:hypothetical protein
MNSRLKVVYCSGRANQRPEKQAELVTFAKTPYNSEHAYGQAVNFFIKMEQ